MKVSWLSALLPLTLVASAHAGAPTMKETPAPAPELTEEGGWWFRVAPYAWLTAIEGDVALGGITAPVDVSFSDTLDTLDMGAMFGLEAGYDRWSVGLDVIYGQFSADIERDGRLLDKLRYEQEQWLLTPHLAYRAVDSESVRLDVYAGARITYMDTELTVDFAGDRARKLTRDVSFADPIIGLRGEADLGESVFVTFAGDIGGFGVSSDLVWEAFAGLGYRITNNVNAVLGYRGLGTDYEDDQFTMDTVTHGPVLGIGFRF